MSTLRLLTELHPLAQRTSCHQQGCMYIVGEGRREGPAACLPACLPVYLLVHVPPPAAAAGNSTYHAMQRRANYQSTAGSNKYGW
jgi:hypothetical protein